jgi:hypothetical protein
MSIMELWVSRQKNLPFYGLRFFFSLFRQLNIPLQASVLVKVKSGSGGIWEEEELEGKGEGE